MRKKNQGNIMKLFISTLTLLILFTSVCSFSNNENNKELSKQIGENIIQILEDAKEIAYFPIESLEPSYENKPITERYLSEPLVSELKELLLNDHNYIFGKNKRSIFRPQYGFVFNGENNNFVTILISPETSQIRVLHNDVRKLLNIDIINGEITTLLNKLN